MATETLPELLPCPFCGGTNLEFHLYPGGCPDGFIQCSDCTTCGPESEATHEAAAASWNAREAVPADADALEKAMRVRRLPGGP